VRTGVGANGLNVRVVAGADGSTVGTRAGGLRPPAPSSVEPNGIPVRPPGDNEPIAVGDEADAAAGPARELPVVAQPGDAIPLVPPPSKTEVVPDMVAPEDMPVLGDILVLEDMAVLELLLVLPVAHGALPLVDSTPEIVGLTPGDTSSIAPRGIPVGATAPPGPIPSGDVMPSGEVPGGDPPTCAIAEPLPKRSAARAGITKRIIITPLLVRESMRDPGDMRSE
jgi:hypothetical protein